VVVAPSAANGAESAAIALDLGVTVNGAPGSASNLASLMVGGIPTGALLTDGINRFTGGSGTQPVDVHTWSLANLTITPATDANFSLSVAATPTGSTAATTGSELVTVAPVAPTVVPVAASGPQGQPIALNLGIAPKNLSSGDANVLSSVTISGIPAGATLSNGAGPLTVSGGSISFTAAQLAAGALSGLAITPPANGTSFSLTVAASQQDAQGDLSTPTTATEPVTVTPTAGRTISTSVTGPVVLSAGDNPLTITNTGKVTSSGADGVQGPAGTAWAVTNAGTVSSSGADGIGLFTGGSISNAATGLVSATNSNRTGAGVYIGGSSGSVTNTGTIAAATSRNGILLNAGGTVTNGPSGVIAGYYNGIETIHGPGAVTNQGSISATGSQNGAAIYIESTGTVTNTATGKITSAKFGVFLEGGFSTFDNYGSVYGVVDAVVAGRGGAVTNAAGASITAVSTGVYIKYRDAGTVTNAGSISATGPVSSAGVDLGDGGTVTNLSHASIYGRSFGVFVNQLPGTIANTGTIQSMTYGAVALQAGGSVTNAAGAFILGGSSGASLKAGGSLRNDGSINASGAGGAGAYFSAGGAVTNSASGSLSGTAFGVFVAGASANVTNNGLLTGGHGVALYGGGNLTNTASILGGVAGVASKGAAATITNSGTITAPSADGAGADIEAGGSITNLAGGSISGTKFGVFLTGGSGTVTNAGAISGGTYAVNFLGNGTNRLVIQDGGTFAGPVGGSTIASNNVLEFAGGAGAISGATAGQGTVTANSSTWSFLHFDTVEVDAGTTLTVNGSASTDAVFLLNGGSLDIASIIGANPQIRFLDSSNLFVDDFQQFGPQGTPTYAGPQLQDFGIGDAIDLKNFSSASDTFSFDSTKGLLQITNGSSQHASLAFQSSSLSSTNFQFASDGGAGTRVTVA
jgi:hypothetical protein